MPSDGKGCEFDEVRESECSGGKNYGENADSESEGERDGKRGQGNDNCVEPGGSDVVAGEDTSVVGHEGVEKG